MYKNGNNDGDSSSPTIKFTHGGLRRKILDRNHKAVVKEGVFPSEKSVLNTAFCKSITLSSPVISSPCPKVKPTTINACSTPSSLHKNGNLTPKGKIGSTFRNAKDEKNLKKKPSACTGKVIISCNSTDTVNPDDQTEISNLTVAVRVRPLNALECTKSSVKNIVRVSGNELTILAGTNADSTAGVTHSFTYDNVYFSCDPESKNYASQLDVFEGTAKPLIDRAFGGYNACLFAYGQTGSGKSYSMMGIDPIDNGASIGNLEPHMDAGIIPRFCYELFRRVKSIKHSIEAEIEISYFEIYNEKIHDLLSVSTTQASNANATLSGMNINQIEQRSALKVREHPIWGPYVVNLSLHPVDSYESLRNWLAVGNSQRATAATGMNSKSSRSHSILNIALNLTEMDHKSSDRSIRHTRRSKISLVDLAGSERISAFCTNEERIREGVSINKSLLTLGKVIAALADGRKSTANPTFVPYRESVLTWLLRESLGGNSKTVMLATISPANLHIEETLATLRYACQARSIVNRVKVNESPHDKIIRELRAEVDRLKSLRNEYERQKRLSANGLSALPRKIVIETTVDEGEVESLRQQLAERERELKQAQKSWMERLTEAEDLRQSELRLLKRKGLALELSADQKQPCLVNLTADPILSGTLLYLLPPGRVRIGRTRSTMYCKQPDIMLDGPLVAVQHCLIENENGELYITPENEDFETFLNGELIVKRQQLFHGDRLVIGGSHYFRISNPFCSKKGHNLMVDFHLAHQEILEKQETKLRQELEEEKRVALLRIEQERLENERNFHHRMQKLELDQLKLDCNNEILEAQRKILEDEKKAIEVDADMKTMLTPSHKSTLLEDIQRIMLTPSEKNLHQTQILVKEATVYCRNLNLPYEFRQGQVLDEFGIFRAVVLILDRVHERKAEWPVARLNVWLDRMRNNENGLTNVFDDFEIAWQPLEEELNETLNDSNCSRISLNLSIVKEALTRKPLEKLSSPSKAFSKSHGNIMSSPRIVSKQSLRGHTKKILTYNDQGDDNKSPNDGSFLHSPASARSETSMLALRYVRDMQRSASKLKKLCQSNDENQGNCALLTVSQKFVHDSINNLEETLQKLHIDFERNALLNEETSSPKNPISVRFLMD